MALNGEDVEDLMHQAELTGGTRQLYHDKDYFEGDIMDSHDFGME